MNNTPDALSETVALDQDVGNARKILVDLMIFLRDGLRRLPELNDPEGEDAAIIWADLLINEIWPGFHPTTDTKAPEAGRKTALGTLSSVSSRFERWMSIREKFVALFPESFVSGLRSNPIIRRLYCHFAYLITRHPAYLLEVKPVKSDENTVFLGHTPTIVKALLAADRGSLEKAADRYLRANGEKLRAAMSFRDDLAERGTDVLLVSHAFPTTWTGLSASLARAGIRLAWVGSFDGRGEKGYGVASVEGAGIASHITDFPLVLILAAAAGESIIAINSEAYFHANWNVERAAVMYLFIDALLYAIKINRASDAKKVAIICYDGIKPIIWASGSGAIATYFYKDMMSRADAVIYNSNAPSFHEFLTGATGANIPSVHLYRITAIDPACLKKGQARKPYIKDKELHIACISVALGEFPEPSRDAVPEFLLQLIAQPGIRFHYYCDQSGQIDVFRKNANKDIINNIEFHDVIRDQNALIEDLQKYHLGFTPFDHAAFAKGIACLENRFYKDALSAFWQSTIATSFFVYAAAGLPIVVPRGCGGIQRFVPEECILRASLSEIPLLAKRVHSMDYPAVMDAAERNRTNFTHSHLEDFLHFTREK